MLFFNSFSTSNILYLWFLVTFGFWVLGGYGMLDLMIESVLLKLLQGKQRSGSPCGDGDWGKLSQGHRARGEEKGGIFL
jgi:hypothetical protein